MKNSGYSLFILREMFKIKIKFFVNYLLFLHIVKIKNQK